MFTSLNNIICFFLIIKDFVSDKTVIEENSEVVLLNLNLKSMKAILLVRVSTQIQNYEAQTYDLINYAKSLGYEDLKIIETKESGFSNIEVKQGSAEMFSFIKENPEYNTVIATELSRLSRRQSILHQVKEWFIRNKVQFILKDFNYNLFDKDGNVSPAGDIMFAFYGYIAEQEMEQKKKRFRRSKEMLMEQGYSIAGKTLFGYKKVLGELKKNTLAEDEINADIVRTIFNWYLNGIDNKIKNPSIKTITLECIKRNFPNYTHSKRNVNKLLKEEGYTGFKITNNKRKNLNYEEGSNEEKYIVTNFKIKYPQIIDNETFELVQQKLLSNNTNVEKSSKHTTLLAKLIRCENCGSHFNANYRFIKGINKSSYRCSSHSSAKPCPNKQTISMSMVDSAIWNLIKTDLELLAKQINVTNPDETLNNSKNHLDALLLKQQEFQAEFQTELKSLEIVKKSKNVKIDDFLSKFEQNTARIDKAIGKITKEISKVRLLMNVQQKNNDDIADVINKNLDKIESSKDLLKEYINLFVEEIRIIMHDTKFSVFQVILKNYSHNVIEVNGYNQRVIKEAELEKINSILLDKRQTVGIKMYKSRKLIYPRGKSLVVGRFPFQIPIPEILSNLNNVKTFPALREVKKVEFSKLVVY